jgi:hypothetical protein
MLGAVHPCQLAVHSSNGQLYLRTLTPQHRESWLRAVKASAAAFEKMRQLASLLPTSTLAGDKSEVANQTWLDAKVCTQEK